MLTNEECIMSNPVTPLNPEQTAAAEKNSSRHNYIQRVLQAVDMLGDALADQPNDMTISTSEGIAALKDKGFTGFQARVVCHVLGWIQHNHDARAAAGDYWRAESAIHEINESGIIHAEPQTKTD